MTTEQEMEHLAGQLRQPSGEAGIKVGNMMNESNMGMSRHAIGSLQLLQGHRVLELGHGNGGHIAFLLEQAAHIRYSGLEVSELMIQEAQRLNAEAIQNQQADFYLYDGLHLPFEPHRFDRVFTVNTIYFWEDPDYLLKEIYRTTVPGGLFNISFAQKEFMQQLPFTRFGFELYDTARAEQLVAASPWQLSGLASATETVKSKTGDTMERTFTTMTLQKATRV